MTDFEYPTFESLDEACTALGFVRPKAVKRIKRRPKYIYVVGIYRMPKELKPNRSGTMILSVHRSLVRAKRAVPKANWQGSKGVYLFEISETYRYWIERHTIAK